MHLRHLLRLLRCALGVDVLEAGLQPRLPQDTATGIILIEPPPEPLAGTEPLGKACLQVSDIMEGRLLAWLKTR